MPIGCPVWDWDLRWQVLPTCGIIGKVRVPWPGARWWVLAEPLTADPGP